MAFAFAIFWRTLGFGLYLDDNHHARPWGLSEVLGTFVGPFDPLGIEPVYYRPLPVVTFAIDWTIWQFNPWGYHLTNVVLHGLASVMVLLLLRRLRLGDGPALVGAVFFAAIPANAATAIYISERSDALVAIFGVGAMLAAFRYLTDTRPRWLVLVNLMTAAAMASKEAGVAVPLLVVLVGLHVVMSEELAANPLRSIGSLLRATLSSGRGRLLWLCGPPFAVLALYLLLRVLVLPTGLVGKHYGDQGLVRCFIDAVWWTLKGVPWEVPAPARFPLALTVVCVLACRPRRPLLLPVVFGLLTVALGCLPLARLGQVEPRLLYLPEVGNAVFVAAMVSLLWKEWSERRSSGWRRGLLAVAAVSCLALGVATAIGQKQAQDQFQPLGYKMLKANRLVLDSPKRHLYPAHNVENIERVMKYAVEHDLDGAR